MQVKRSSLLKARSLFIVKNGEKVSGDTHSVIRINDHSFLMALSDGMGSGEYARKVSESAISLIEAFYRAEMPEDNVLNTINKRFKVEVMVSVITFKSVLPKITAHSSLAPSASI